MIKQYSNPEIVWELKEHSKVIFEKIGLHEKWILDEYKKFKFSIPIAKTYQQFPLGLINIYLKLFPAIGIHISKLKALIQFSNPGPYFTKKYIRPKGDQISFYKIGPKKGVIGFKGSECLCKDLPEGLEGLSRYPAPEGFAWHYSQLENKIMFKHDVPFAVKLRDAINEASLAVDFHESYYESFGSFAAVPVPLMICKWPDSVSIHLLELIKKFLRPFELNFFTELIEDGLGYYIFYYPFLPKKMGQIVFQSLLGPYSLHGYERRLDVFNKLNIFPDNTVKQWVQLITRMLSLGYVPCNPSYVLDQCISSQNVTISGGITSLKSVQKIEQIKSKRDLYESLFIMIMELSNTTRDLILRPLDNLENYSYTFGDLFFESDMTIISSWIWNEFKNSMDEISNHKESIDSWILDFFSLEFSFQSLSNLLDLIYADPRIEQWEGMNEVWE